MGPAGRGHHRQSAERAVSDTRRQHTSRRIPGPLAGRDPSRATFPNGSSRRRKRTSTTLQRLLKILASRSGGRPRGRTKQHSRPYTGTRRGYYNYCPRDVMMVVGDQIIETPNVIRSRSQETYSYRALLMEYMASGARWISAPRPMLLDSLFEGIDMDTAHAA